MERVKVISWNRVSLVVPEKYDIDLWYKWINDTEIQSFLWPVFWSIISKKSEEDFFESLNKDNKTLTFSIYSEELNKSIWNISLNSIDYKNNHSELWIAIFDKDNQNKGYWTEAIKLILKYAFEILWLNKVYLRYISNNSRAKEVYEKCWFTEVWRMKNHEYRFWEYYDDVIMEIFGDEYIEKDKLA